MRSLMLMALVICGLAAAENWTPDVIRQFGNYRLEITYLNKGTRSEGMEGKLFANDLAIQGTAGQVIMVDQVTLRFYGEKREFPWATTGWNCDPVMGHSWAKSGE